LIGKQTATLAVRMRFEQVERRIMESAINRLLHSDEPSVRFKVRVNVLGSDVGSPDIGRLRQEIRSSRRVQELLAERDADGNIPYHPYAKWYGAHWVLADLADIGYPPGDESLIPLREQVYEWLFGQRHQSSIKTINGRVRRCASQEGNAIYYLLSLGLADEHTDELARRLVEWQWPDGGWNCDKNPEAVNSSFMESLIPLRGLALHARVTGDRQSQAAAECAAEIFLKRRLYKRQSDGRVINYDFVKLHYPCYWHYDILFGMKVMAEAGFIGDARCADALDLLESKRLPGGGWPAGKKYYRVTGKRTTGLSRVDWGGTGKRYMNEWVTADALYVLQAAGRLDT
jgi:hypothetical protein